MDYRTIPVEKLNSNIPRGRGMIKWAPFATMPEQFENVDKMVQNQTKITRPTLTDDRLEEIDTILKDAIKHSYPVKIYYYFDGNRLVINIKIIRIDHWSLHVIGEEIVNGQNGEIVFLPFADILNIEKL